MTPSAAPRGGDLKSRMPRVAKDLANVTTRGYGLVTARWRPPPDFLIVGTKRGGTTTLWNAMVKHPQVLGMFPQPRGLKSTSWFFDEKESMRWYRSHFASVGYRSARAKRVGRTVVGEASPYYMYGPHVPARMASVVPKAKLIVLLRNPVERAYSHYQERRQEGVEHLSFEDALAAEPGRLAPGEARRAEDPLFYDPAHDFFSYRDRGVYLPQIERLQASFAADQILVLLSEEFYRDPLAVLDRIATYLGIEAWPPTPVAHHNLIRRSGMAEATRRELEAFYAPWNAALATHLSMDLGW